MGNGAPKKVKVPPKRPAYMSEDKKSGKTVKSENWLNWVKKTMPKFKGGLKDPHFKKGAWRIDVDDKDGKINVRGKIEYKGGLKGLWKKIKEGD